MSRPATIAARPGQRVEITLNNTDDMPHNIVIFRRGTIAEYEKDLPLFQASLDYVKAARGR